MTGAGQPTTPFTAEAWDAYVRAHSRATYLQTTAWAETKRSTGWSPVLIAGRAAEHGAIGARVLLRQVPVLPWQLAYAPRGPLADAWSRVTLAAWTGLLRSATARGGSLARAALARMDPEVEEGTTLPSGEPFDAALRDLGWRRTHDVQPRRTRIVDLTVDEATLWSDLRKKWRQYVNKARSSGIVVRDVDPKAEPDAFDTFHRVMRDVSRRTALPLRTAAAFREVWAAFAPSGESRLLFADGPDRETLAVLLLVSCGTRVVEPYGGMTDTGAELRANYLLKWEAIRSSRERGATSYDMWGLIHPGINQFKEGFGGREVRYVGAWDLPLTPVGAMAFRAAEDGARGYRALRRRLRGEKLALPPGPESDG
jgi:peptidoglycan pentaglycine glycine transferase (the first glycine)